MSATKEDFFSNPLEPPVNSGIQVNGKDVYLVPMTAHDYDKYEEETLLGDKINYADFRCRLLVKMICDEKGTLIFSDDDATTLSSKMKAPLIKLLYDKAITMNHITEEEVEELLGN